MTVDAPTWGLVEPGVLDRLVVVSPHMDDAVLGAAHVLDAHPGSTVVTVFAGRPADYPVEPTEWDAQGGFAAGDDVVALRRAEDREGLAVLGATPVWLDFVDHQYRAAGEEPVVADVAESVLRAVDAAGATAVLLPMGIANPDHVTTFDAGLLVREQRPALGWFCYEDHGYKHVPGLLAWRITKLFRSGLWPTPAIVPMRVDMARKGAAIECYRSQVAPLEAEHALRERLAANVPEQVWRLAPPPSGWEGLTELA